MTAVLLMKTPLVLTSTEQYLSTMVLQLQLLQTSHIHLMKSDYLVIPTKQPGLVQDVQRVRIIPVRHGRPECRPSEVHREHADCAQLAPQRPVGSSLATRLLLVVDELSGTGTSPLNTTPPQCPPALDLLM